ncbi:MAG TPA: hypothetical protein VIX84_09095 [Acidimicrobiales bacterium]
MVRVRIWLPDAPGVLGAVAGEIGAVKGNVLGFEVLEREAGVAVDELVVELPDDPGSVDALSRGVRFVPGTGVEEVTELREPAGAHAHVHLHDREESILAAAASILEGATPEAALEALTNDLIVLFSLTWLALMDDALEQFVETHGDLPSVEWVVAFAEGARSGSDPANDTTGSGVFIEPVPGFIEPVPGSGLTVCGGRSSAIRRRERHEITMLVTVAARYIDALMGRGLGGLRSGGG